MYYTIAHSGWHDRRVGTACLKKWYGDAHHCKKWYGVGRTSRTFYAAPVYTCCGICIHAVVYIVLYYIYTCCGLCMHSIVYIYMLWYIIIIYVPWYIYMYINAMVYNTRTKNIKKNEQKVGMLLQKRADTRGVGMSNMRKIYIIIPPYNLYHPLDTLTSC